MSERTRVVIAEDHTLVREGTREILERVGRIEVVGEAADGEEAIRLVRRLRPHVAIIDIGMPKVDGIEATRRIKADRPEVAVLILTVHDEDQYAFALLEAGAAGYLLKDVGGAELVKAVEAVRAGESVLHPAIVGKVLSRFHASDVRGTHGPSAGEALTPRERDILERAARGLSNKEIAHEASVSARTVQVHLARIFRKLGVASRTEAVVRGLRQGWLRLEDLP